MQVKATEWYGCNGTKAEKRSAAHSTASSESTISSHVWQNPRSTEPPWVLLSSVMLLLASKIACAEHRSRYANLGPQGDFGQSGAAGVAQKGIHQVRLSARDDSTYWLYVRFKRSVSCCFAVAT